MYKAYLPIKCHITAGSTYDSEVFNLPSLNFGNPGAYDEVTVSICAMAIGCQFSERGNYPLNMQVLPIRE